MNKPVQYAAVLVDHNGNTQPATGVTWSTSDQEIATISAAGVITAGGPGSVGITASVNINGATYTASVPLGIRTPSVFTVAPSAIIWNTEAGPIELHPVYFGTQSPTFSYESSNSSIASVSSAGIVTFTGNGTCEITVTANGITGDPSIRVPVMVVGKPPVVLPVMRVSVSPVSTDMFRGETQTLVAKAFNKNNDEVNTTFSWKVGDNSVGTITADGVFTARGIGQTTIQATAQGIIGQAEVIVNPDTIIIIDPMYVTVNSGSSSNMTAKTYKINRTNDDLTLVTTPASLRWEIPSMGLPMFDVATVDQSGKVTVKAGAMTGMMAFVTASVPGSESIEPGLSTVIVGGGGTGNDCDCGSENAAVQSVTTGQNTYSLSIMGTQRASLNAKALDSDNKEVAGAAIVYCSDSETVAMVDDEGEITATGPGEARITVCVGSKKKTVTVTVTF
jgi:uncharacterized protein YjdB